MGVLGEIGTLEWTRRTNGILGRGERARYVAAALLAQGRGTPRLLAARTGLGGRGGPDPSELTPPDSAVAREVTELCAAELEETVVEHSLRSHLYARALASAEGVECDVEAVFVGAMLHDLGVSQVPALRDRCFTLPAAERAHEITTAAGWEPQRADATAESITMHVNPDVPASHGEVQHLVHDGVFCDVLGLRASELDRDGIKRVRERHPRLRFNQVGGGALREHARNVPGCRVAAAWVAGFGLALRLGPWQD